MGHDAPDPVFASGHQEALNPGLLQVEVRRRFQNVLHIQRIAALVGLGPQGMDRRPLALVQQPDLDMGVVDSPRHLAAQRIDLPHQVTLAWPSHTRITGHLGHKIQVHGQ